MIKEIKEVTHITIRFAGDSGDGMQLAGNIFGDNTALVGHDLSTLPDYPSEIRAPAGSLYGVSGFQLHFGSQEIYTPGDQPDVLVAMNPAALKVNLKDLYPGAIIVVNSDSFDQKNLQLAQFESNPLEDGTLSKFNVISVPITTLTLNALEGMGLSMKEMTRCKNFFTLGLIYWMFDRPLEPTIKWIKEKFTKNPKIAEANEKALKAGYYYGETTEIFTMRFSIKPAKLEPGVYRNVMGNEALALGFVAASKISGLPLFQGSYPITPASEVLHELSALKHFDVKTFQAEDEIAGILTALGASYAGNLAVTTTSGPGFSLKSEAMGLAVMVELPLVIVDIQRAGPSTGMPTKTEQGDLLQAMFGRNGEAPLPIIAPKSPSDCFNAAYEASRIAIKYMTPVVVLSEGYIAQGSEPWRIPDPEELPKIEVHFATPEDKTNGKFQPYVRNELNVRPWAIPQTPGLEHRIGGLEKRHITGEVTSDPNNHEFMVRIRNEKIQNIANDIPLLDVYGDDEGDILVLSWGGTFGAIRDAVNRVREEGYKVSQAHLFYINPFPRNLGDILSRFNQVVIPELNLGQLAFIIRSKYLIPVVQLNKVQGLPFRSMEIQNKIYELLGVK